MPNLVLPTPRKDDLRLSMFSHYVLPQLLQPLISVLPQLQLQQLQPQPQPRQQQQQLQQQQLQLQQQQQLSNPVNNFVFIEFKYRKILKFVLSLLNSSSNLWVG